MLSPTELGDRLRRVREWRRLSQEELGHRIQAGQKKISQLERGKATFAVTDLLALAEVLHFRIEVFCREDPHGFDIVGCLLPVPKTTHGEPGGTEARP